MNIAKSRNQERLVKPAFHLPPLRYRLDTLTGTAIAAVALDTFTTVYFLHTGLGSEMNPVLAPLAAKSLIWVVVYLLGRALLLPLFPDVSRQVIASYYLCICLIFGASNWSGIIHGDYWAVRVFGFWSIQAFAICVTVATWLWLLVHKSKNRAAALRSTLVLLGCIALLIATEAAFYLLGRGL